MAQTLRFGASSFNVHSLNDSVNIHNVDTLTMLTLGNFYDIEINKTDLKMKIDRVYRNISFLANNIIVPDTGSTFDSDSKISYDYSKAIRFDGTEFSDFYKITGAYYEIDSLLKENFKFDTGGEFNAKIYELDYKLSHSSDNTKDILLTFEISVNNMQLLIYKRFSKIYSE